MTLVWTIQGLLFGPNKNSFGPFGPIKDPVRTNQGPSFGHWPLSDSRARASVWLIHSSKQGQRQQIYQTDLAANGGCEERVADVARIGIVFTGRCDCRAPAASRTSFCSASNNAVCGRQIRPHTPTNTSTSIRPQRRGVSSFSAR
jgi:hypothetical protein